MKVCQVLVVVAAILLINSVAGAVVLSCPQTVQIKAVSAPFPWSDASHGAAQLSFAQASYSCSNGTCTLSCSYTAPGQAYTLLEYKVPPGTCDYTSEGTAFACSSLPQPRKHRKHID
jgi:hypothetical protein